ncbi:MAG: TRAP transporter large permease [Cohaesibacteraceae bacterium]|nr:TRAP transporter large permease [Cohaesibacteraceae bacterium]
MSDIELAILSFFVLIGMIFIRIPIGLAMLLCGLTGTWIVTDSYRVVLGQMKVIPFDTFSSYSLTIVPLFLLMGQFATRGGMSKALFKAAESFLGHRKGGIAMAAIGACAGFGAICGSSLATAATMANVALPEMRRAGYSNSLATGCLAAGGTLGILIPPSVVLVIYAILAEQNIVKMFAAALIPGILAAIGYMITVAIYVRLNPESATSLKRQPWSARMKALFEVWPVMLIFSLVIGGIYMGWFTPTEGAAVGAMGTGLLAYAQGGLGWKELKECIFGTAAATGMIFFIILGASVYNTFLALTQLPQDTATMVGNMGVDPWLVLIMILACYLVFGCIMDSLSMILLTIPIFFPVVMGLDFGMSSEETAIWFGILVLIVVEVGLITPPVGMNIFIINNLAKTVSMKESYRGVIPFVISDLVRVVILTAFPFVTLFLVRALDGKYDNLLLQMFN